MQVIDYAPLINGIGFKVNEGKNPLYEDPSIFEALKMLKDNNNLEEAVTATKFFEAERELKYKIPVKYREEFFFAAKNGEVYKDVPAYLVYLINYAIKNFGSPNYFLYLANKQTLRRLLSPENFYNGVTCRDLIISLTGFSQYSPLSESNYKSRTSEQVTDIYIEEQDAIAMLPADLAEKLSTEDIKAIKLERGMLTLNGVDLLNVLGLAGVRSSTYDLRRVI